MTQKFNSLALLRTTDICLAFKAKDLIFRQGDEGQQMFMIKSGVVELKSDDLIIGAFQSGEIIGEMALVDHAPRSATAVALTDCELIPIDNARFQSMVVETPGFAVEVMQVMAERLRHMNREVNYLYKRAVFTQLQAMTDALTGIGNRRAWDERMVAEESRCRRHGHSACVVAIDLNGLKVLNDTAGHARGDALLKDTADELRQACRESDFVARLGGDEFGILAVECQMDTGKRLTQAIDERLKKRGIDAAIGTAMRNPARDLYHAWEEADQTMYAVKRARKTAR